MDNGWGNSFEQHVFVAYVTHKCCESFYMDLGMNKGIRVGGMVCDMCERQCVFHDQQVYMYSPCRRIVSSDRAPGKSEP